MLQDSRSYLYLFRLTSSSTSPHQAQGTCGIKRNRIFACAMGMGARRGALIVFEGLDRSGKSTQCKLLTDSLTESGRKVKLLRFPDRTTAIGSAINQYLENKIGLSDKAAHLLFSANRWELEPHIRDSLASGVTVVLDRYVYSGVVYSCAKEGMFPEFCSSPEEGLPRPDTVFFIDINSEEQVKRGSFGAERYERVEFQKKVAEGFAKYRRLPYWKVIDGSRSADIIHQEILSDVQEICQKVEQKPIQVIEKGELC